MLAWVGIIGIFLLTTGGLFGLGVLRRQGFLPKLRSLVVSLLFLSTGVLCLGLVMALRSFEAFASSTRMPTKIPKSTELARVRRMARSWLNRYTRPIKIPIARPVRMARISR